MFAVLVGLSDETGYFVMGHPMLHPVAQALDHLLRILGKGAGDVAVDPAAFVLKGLGQIPME